MIRDARIQDVPTIIQLAAEMHAESSYATLPYSPSRVKELAASLIHAPLGILVVAEDGHGVFGMMAGQVGGHFFCDVPVATEYALYVKPEKRGGLAGPKLLAQFVAEARKRGASRIVLGDTANISDKASRLYEKAGFKQFGRLYQRDL